MPEESQRLTESCQISERTPNPPGHREQMQRRARAHGHWRHISIITGSEAHWFWSIVLHSHSRWPECDRSEDRKKQQHWGVEESAFSLKEELMHHDPNNKPKCVSFTLNPLRWTQDELISSQLNVCPETNAFCYTDKPKLMCFCFLVSVFYYVKHKHLAQYLFISLILQSEIIRSEFTEINRFAFQIA